MRRDVESASLERGIVVIRGELALPDALSARDDGLGVV